MPKPASGRAPRRRPAAVTAIALVVSALLHTAVVPVNAQTEINLKGVNGETTCSLRDQLNAASCEAPSARDLGRLNRRDGEFTAVPSSCTCNIPFFNIWSVCTFFEDRSNALPYLKDWQTKCQGAGINFSPAIGRNLGAVQLPKWAQVGAPGDDAVFDVAGIVMATLPTKRWDTLQIVAPVVSAALVAFLLGVVFICRRRKPAFASLSASSSLFDKVPFRFLRPSQVRVEREEPKGDWVIDRNEDVTPFPSGHHRRSMSKDSAESTGYGFSFQNQGRPQSQSRVTLQPNRHHREEDSSDPDKYAPAALDLTEEPSVDFLDMEPPEPLTSRWSDSEHPANSSTLTWTATTTAAGTGTGKSRRKMGSQTNSLQNVFKGIIPNPFKSKPVRAQSVAPRPGFRLDDYDQNTESLVSPKVPPGKTAAAAAAGKGGESRYDRVSVDGDSLYGAEASYQQQVQQHQRRMSSPMQDVDEEQQERLTLISGEERRENDVFLISKNGRDFSISDTMGTGTGTGTGTNVTMRTNTTDGVNSNIGIVSPTASTMSFKTAFDQLNQNHPPVPALPVPLPPPPRGPPPKSPSKLAFSNPNTPRYPLANLPDFVPSTDGNGNTMKKSRWEPKPIDQTTGPSPPPNLLHPPLRSVYETERYPSVETLHQRSHSYSTLDLGQPPRRLLEDDGTSFYLTAAEEPSRSNSSLGMHLRKGSMDNLHPRRSDPQMLFPAAVRAAGYYGLAAPDNSD